MMPFGIEATDAARRRWGLWVIAVVTFSVLLAGWPALHGFWVRDDLTQLAYVRLLGTPWPLFVQDHFPVPASIFRPLGFASLWLSQQLWGVDYQANTLADLLLHVGVVLALYRLLRLAATPWLALLGSLAFALQPLVMATVFSWSNRFDLLVALFGLLAIYRAIDASRSARWPPLLAMAGWVLAALLSKESGAIALAACAAVLLNAMWLRRIDFRRGVAGLSCLTVVGLGYFLWRRAVLGPSASAITGDASLPRILLDGSLLWWRHLPGYLGLSSLALTFILLGMVVLAVLAWRLRRRDGRDQAGLWLASLALLVLPAMVQAPIAVLNAAAPDAAMSAVEVGMQARLYYVGLCGLSVLLILLASPMAASPNRLVRNGLTAALVLLVALEGRASHALAKSHAARSSQIAAPARAIVDWIAGHPLPPAPCRVVILGYLPPPEWDIVTPLDSVVKALVPDLDPVSACLFANEHTTYIHQFAVDHVDSASVLPWVARQHAGVALPWLRIGGLAVAYLDPPALLTDADRSSMLFLAIEPDGSVRDVSDAVRRGERVVVLR